MQHTQTEDLDPITEMPAVRRIAVTSAFAWLRQGWHDLRRAWMASLAHGVLFAALGWGLVNWGWESHYSLTFTSGFLMVAPLLAICFYDISRSLEQGQPVVSLSRPIRILRANPWTLAMFVILLALLFSLWERVTAVMVALTLRADVVAQGSFSYLQHVAADPHHLPVVIGFFAVGAVFALVAFTLSAVSLPMLVDRPVDIVTAIVTSVRAVLQNPLSMLLWAAIIAALVLLGYLTHFIGLVVLFPLLGHATWHAYRALVGGEADGGMKQAGLGPA